MNGRSAPLGLFDSGVGGLGVFREVRALLPHEPLLSYADSARCPYGDKSPAAIFARATAVGELLLARGAKLLVVARNTATSVALPTLRARFSTVPIVGMVPTVKPAAAATRIGKIGVLATPRTVTGDVLAGPNLTLIDAGPAVARRTRDVLDAHALRAPGSTPGALTLLTSGDAAPVSALASRLLGSPVIATRLLVPSSSASHVGADIQPLAE